MYYRPEAAIWGCPCIPRCTLFLASCTSWLSPVHCCTHHKTMLPEWVTLAGSPVSPHTLVCRDLSVPHCPCSRSGSLWFLWVDWVPSPLVLLHHLLPAGLVWNLKEKMVVCMRKKNQADVFCYCIYRAFYISQSRAWIRGCREPRAPLNSPAAPSNFCREPKNVMVSIHNSCKWLLNM